MELRLEWPGLADSATVAGAQIYAYGDQAMIQVTLDKYEDNTCDCWLTPEELRQLGRACYVLAKRLDDRASSARP
jgi:hypothetical protein